MKKFLSFITFMVVLSAVIIVCSSDNQNEHYYNGPYIQSDNKSKIEPCLEKTASDSGENDIASEYLYWCGNYILADNSEWIIQTIS